MNGIDPHHDQRRERTMNTKRPETARDPRSGTSCRTTGNHAGPLVTICRYPNLLAEYKESRYDLLTLCDHADLTPDEMTAVLTNGAGLPASAMLHLSQLFGVRFSYLASNELMTFTPNTPTGKHRMTELHDLFRSIYPDRDLFRDPYHNAIYHRAVRYLTDAQNEPDRPRTYAGWRWTRDGILAVIDFQGRAKRQRERNRRKAIQRAARRSAP